MKLVDRYVKVHYTILSTFYLFEIVCSKKLKNTIEKGKKQHVLLYPFVIHKDLTVTLLMNSCLNYQGILTESLCLLREVVESYSASATDTRGTE